MKAVLTTIRCSQVESWQAPSKSFNARNALKYADWTTSRASSSLRVRRRATASRRPPKWRTIASKAHSCPARSASSRAGSLTLSLRITVRPRPCGTADSKTGTPPEELGALVVGIRDLFELFPYERGTVHPRHLAHR